MRLFGLVAALILLAAAPAAGDTAGEGTSQNWRPKSGDEIRFDVLRQGKPFGHHIVRFEREESDTLKVDVDVELRAGLGPITLFRYELEATELWRDNELFEATGEVVEDGAREVMRARREGEMLRVEGDGFSGELPASILPASHWNVAQTGASELLSTENGELIPVDVVTLGRETILAGGQPVEARKFLMDGDIDVTLWYDDAGRWLKLAFEARGQQIEYVLTEFY